MADVYLAAPESRDLAKVLRNMFRGLREGSYLGYRLFRKSLLAERVTSKLTLLWDLFEPLVLACVFVFLYRNRALEISNLTIPYALFVTVGVLTWQVFADAITLPLDLLPRFKDLLSHSKIAPEALMLSVIYHVCFASCFRLIVIVGVAIFSQLYAPIGLLLLPLGLFILILAGFSVGLFLAPFNAIYGDVGRVTRISLRPLMFVSAVLFPLPREGFLSTFAVVNPIAVLISNLRSLLVHGTLIRPELVAAMVACFALTLLVGWFIFHLSVKISTENA